MPVEAPKPSNVDSLKDPFKPPQPVIPGVPARASFDRRAASAGSAANSASVAPKGSEFSAPLWPVYLFIATVVIFTVVLRVEVTAQRARSHVAAAAPIATPTASDHPVDPSAGIPTAPGPIASTQELNKPWAAKRFIFRNQLTGEMIPAEVVHLPGGGFWAISLKEPYGSCQLNYVTDTKELRDEYQVNAGHPMVVNPCNRSVFDLAEYASAPSGLVRGVVIAGAATRPPIAIEVKVEGSKVVATRSE
jgi:hypothetical protein